jgi:hypothetical protein
MFDFDIPWEDFDFIPTYLIEDVFNKELDSFDYLKPGNYGIDSKTLLFLRSRGLHGYPQTQEAYGPGHYEIVFGVHTKEDKFGVLQPAERYDMVVGWEDFKVKLFMLMDENENIVKKWARND